MKPTPAAPGPTAKLTADVEAILDRFEQAWQGPALPRIEEFFPPSVAADGNRRTLLEELVKIDLECRWQRSGRGGPEPWRLEEYLRRYPELIGLSIDLVGEEYRVRYLWGDRPSHVDYGSRFPQLGPALLAQLRRVDAELAQAFTRKARIAARPLPPAPPAATESPPAALVNSLTEFSAVLRKHGLVEEKDVPSVAGGDARALARELVQKGQLTPYQVNQVFLGRAADLVLGPYVLLERLGEGGAGQVFKARHGRMQRVVAIKVIRKDLLSDPEILRRFSREVQAVSRLDHPNIVHAFDADTAGSVHFLAMEFVHGTDLEQLVRRSGPLPVAHAVAYIRQAAAGLQCVHEHGLVHRDIKPANLLVSGGDEENIATHQVKILDLGLARLRSRSSDGDNTSVVTPVGAVMIGTPNYLAPEQAVDFHGADIRADIYALGCTSYFMLTGQPPFAGGTLAEKLLRHQQAEAPDLRLRRTDVPAALIEMIDRMMAKQPAERYQTPGQVVAALDALPQLRSLTTVPAGAVRDWPAELPVALPPRRPVRRFRRVALGAASLALLGAFLLWRLIRPNAASQPNPATPPASLDRLNAGALLPTERFAWQPRELVAMLGEHRPVPWGGLRGGAVSRDGKWVAAGGDDSLVRVWNEATQELRTALGGHAGRITAVAFHPDHQTVAAGAADGMVRVWNLHGTEPWVSFQAHTKEVMGLAFAGDGQMLLTGGDRTPKLWRIDPNRRTVDTANPVALIGHTNDVQCVAFVPDGHTAASGGPGAVIVWDTRAGRQQHLAPRLGSYVLSLAFTGDGRRLVAGENSSQGHRVTVLDPATGKELGPTIKCPATFNVVAVSDDGKLAATGGDGVTIWDLPARKELDSFDRGHLTFNAMGFTPGGKGLVAISVLEGVRYWDTTKRKLRSPQPRLHHTISALAFTPDGKTLALGEGVVSPQRSGRVRLWEPLTGRVRTAFEHKEGRVLAVTCAPDGTTVASADERGSIRLWEAATSKERHVWQHGDAINNLVFRPDGAVLAAGGADGRVTLWDPNKGQPLAAWSAHAQQTVILGFTRAGALITGSSRTGEVKEWQTAAPRELRLLKDREATLETAVMLAYEPRNNTLAWSMGSRLTAAPIGGQPAPLRTNRLLTILTFAGDPLISGAVDGTLVRWNVKSLNQTYAHTFPGALRAIAVAPDSRHIATANGNDTVYILRLPD